MKLKDIPHVLNIKGFYFPNKNERKLVSPLLITEFLPNKSLEEFLQSKNSTESKNITIRQLLDIIRKCAQGLDYLPESAVRSSLGLPRRGQMEKLGRFQTECDFW